MVGRGDPFAVLRLVTDRHASFFSRGQGSHLGFDELDAHGLGVLKKLLVPLAEGPDI